MADTFLVIGTGPTVNLVMGTEQTTNIVMGGVGASAYQIWLDEGNAGTEADFLESLVGADGAPGPTYSAGTGIGITGTTITNTAPNVVQTLSIAGQDLTLSGGGGTVAIPAGADGNGIYGGSGTVNDYTTATIAAASELLITDGAFKIQINSDEPRYFIGNSNEQAGVIFSPGSGLNFNVSGSNVFQMNATADASFSVGMNDNALFRIVDSKTVPTGFQYEAEYADILTNDRSIPDVGLTKQLIASENGALGTGFTSGGGTGSIPGETIAVLDTDGQFLIRNQDGNDVFIASATGFRAANGNVNGSMLFDNDGLSVTAGGNILNMSTLGTTVYEDNVDGLGIQYATDYSATIAANPRSIPDVGTVDLLKQTPVSYDNASAPNNCIFYSTTLSKLAYKDPGGTVNPLY